VISPATPTMQVFLNGSVLCGHPLGNVVGVVKSRDCYSRADKLLEGRQFHRAAQMYTCQTEKCQSYLSPIITAPSYGGSCYGTSCSIRERTIHYPRKLDAIIHCNIFEISRVKMA
jgi:hypothetical protein